MTNMQDQNFHLSMWDNLSESYTPKITLGYQPKYPKSAMNQGRMKSKHPTEES